jgi:hypothetical protein
VPFPLELDLPAVLARCLLKTRLLVSLLVYLALQRCLARTMAKKKVPQTKAAAAVQSTPLPPAVAAQPQHCSCSPLTCANLAPLLVVVLPRASLPKMATAQIFLQQEVVPSRHTTRNMPFRSGFWVSRTEPTHAN